MFVPEIITCKFFFQEGEALIQNFLEQVKALAVGDLTDAKFTEALEKLRAEVQAKDNAYVNDVLARGEAGSGLKLL